MNDAKRKRILARRDAASFVGRSAELEHIVSYAQAENAAEPLVVLAAPHVGATELLRQAYDRLFADQEKVIPFYFEFRASDETPENAAIRFLCDLLLQTVAFRRRDARLIEASPEIGEVARLAAPMDGFWIDGLVESFVDRENGSGPRSFVRNCLAAPARAAANGAPIVVLLDGLHVAGGLGRAFLDDILEIFSRGSVPVVMSGYRRLLYGKADGLQIKLDPLPFSSAGRMTEAIAADHNVALNDQTRDLIAVQLGGVAGHVASVVEAAAAAGTGLDNFEAVERVYTDEIFGGRISRGYDAFISRAVPSPREQLSALRLLNEALSVNNGRLHLVYWQKHAGLGRAELEAVLALLNEAEVVRVGSGNVEVDTADIVLCDYIRSRARLELDGRPRGLAVGEALAENIRRAPAIMARFYRRSASVGLREIIRDFDGKQVSPVLLDHGRFVEQLKGAPKDKIIKAALEDNDRVTLPQIVYAASTAALYPPIAELCDAERSAVGIGFADAARHEETAWLAVEVDAKIEATREAAEFWCDRLEMVAAHCSFSNFTMWLVAPEGFAPDAMEALRERNAFGSSRRQVELLCELIGRPNETAEDTEAEEYEFTFPMGENTEMIAAHAIDEIAKRHDFPQKAINQIKTALVEASINAAEHSLSPDGKMYQKFAVARDRVTITVASRGVRLVDREPTSDAGERRGWGLDLIRGLMDDVTFERTDDGTRITMTKSIKR